MNEKEFTNIQQYLMEQFETIKNGTAQFCTLEELDQSLNEIIEIYEKQSLEKHQSNTKESGLKH